MFDKDKYRLGYEPLVIHNVKRPLEIKTGREERRERRKQNRKRTKF